MNSQSHLLPAPLLLPPREEIAEVLEPAVRWRDELFFAQPIGGFCPCMFAADKVACLRALRIVAPVRARPRCRGARRRRAARDPGGGGDGDDDGGDGDGGPLPPPPPAHVAGGVS